MKYELRKQDIEAEIAKRNREAREKEIKALENLTDEELQEQLKKIEP